MAGKVETQPGLFPREALTHAEGIEQEQLAKHARKHAQR